MQPSLSSSATSRGLRVTGFRPKRWPAPRSRRTREDEARKAAGWSEREIFYKTLKSAWSDSGPKPWWATLAFERGWITHVAYLQVSHEKGPTLLELLYDEPFFKMLPKERNFTGVQPS